MPVEVAEYIIGVMPVDNLKLQKLLYYCQGIHLKVVDTPLFNDVIEAWRYGPVVPSVYHKYKHFGFDILRSNEEESLMFERNTRKVIDMTLQYYGEFSGLELGLGHMMNSRG